MNVMIGVSPNKQFKIVGTIANTAGVSTIQIGNADGYAICFYAATGQIILGEN